ncbi:hypothetical protein [Bacillus sp. BHET2]|uniref:hypothetical protein n=1 Tax=Bacillus sp. BHET2 TaxID=2583818 RepID=UPI00148662E7|nr:hypothetical protein [Bacillus sp. BHET2]
MKRNDEIHGHDLHHLGNDDELLWELYLAEGMNDENKGVDGDGSHSTLKSRMGIVSS